MSMATVEIEQMSPEESEIMAIRLTRLNDTFRMSNVMQAIMRMCTSLLVPLWNVSNVYSFQTRVAPMRRSVAALKQTLILIICVKICIERSMHVALTS